MKSFLERRWFLLLLALVLAVGFSWPGRLHSFTAHLPENLVVASVLFLTALPLDIRLMWQALRRPTAALLAVAVSYLFIPLLAWAMSPILRPELAMGLLITASIPCTLASATVWTRRAGGNEAVAILVTMLTNLACFVVTPFWLWMTLGRMLPDGAIDARAMVGKLALIVVVPILVAQGLRLWRSLATWATREKILLGVVSQLGILLMVLCSAVVAGLHLSAEGTTLRPTPLDWAVLVACTVSLHFFALCIGLLASKSVGLPHSDRIAVGIAGSQKTLMVGITVATGFEGAALAILPMVIYHVGQLLIDTFVADWFRAQSTRQILAASPAEEAAEDL